MQDVREDVTQYDPHLIEQKTQTQKDDMSTGLT